MKTQLKNYIAQLTVLLLIVSSVWGMNPSFAQEVNSQLKLHNIENADSINLTGASEGRIVFYDENDLYGYLDYEGNIVIPAQYSYANLFQGGVAQVTLNDEDVFIDLSGKELFKRSTIADQFEEEVYGPDIYTFSDGLARVETYSAAGYIDKSGKFVIPMGKYSGGSDFGSGVVQVFDEDYNSFFIDKEQERLFEPNEDYTYNVFVNGRSIIYNYDNEQYGVVNQAGEIIAKPLFDYAEDFVGHLALYKEVGKYGVINQKGEILLKPTFKDALITEDGYIIGYDGVFTTFLDSNMSPLNRIVGDNLYSVYENIFIKTADAGYTFEDLSGKALGTFDDYYHLGEHIFEISGGRLLDTSQVVSVASGSQAQTLQTDYAFIYLNNKGEEVIRLEGYDNASPFSEGLAVVEKSGKFGYINKNGEVVIPLKYMSAGDFVDGVASVETRDDYLTINKNGKVITPSYDSYEVEESSDFFVVSEGYYGDSGVADRKTKKIILDLKYDTVEAVGNGLFELTDSNYQSGFFNAVTGVVVEPTFNYITIVPDKGLVIVETNDGLYGLYDTAGSLLLEPVYDYIAAVVDGIFELEKDSQYGIANAKGEVILSTEYVSIYSDKVTEDIYAFSTRKDNQNKIVVYDMSKDEILSDNLEGTLVGMSDDFIVLSAQGKTQVANFTGQVLFESTDYFVETSDGYVHFEDNQGADYLVDSSGKAYLRGNSFDTFYLPVHENHIIYSIDNKFGIVDLNGEIKSTQLYTNVSFIESGIMAFYHNEKFGYVDLNGANVIEPGYYDYLYYFIDDLGLVVKTIDK